MIKTTVVLSLSALLLFVGSHALAKTINVPSTPIEKAIETAKKYIQEKKIDVSDSFIGVVEYHNLHNEYERPYWRIRWFRKVGGKGGWFELKVFSDGSIEERPGM
jgi:hypothetical protein